MCLLSLLFTGAVIAQDLESAARPSPVAAGAPTELTMRGAGDTDIDLRALPAVPVVEREREEPADPPFNPVELPGGPTIDPNIPEVPPVPLAPAPAPILTFDGLDRLNWGSGSPPDTNGDAGPNHYIQSVNSSVGIYNKSTGAQIAAFTFDTLMSQGTFGNQCDTENFGDPVVLYDTFEDRWVLTDFAFTLDGGGNVNPPEAFQCFAVSKTADPVSGGWWFYSIKMTDFLNDYPKFGVWTDGIYMSANMFGFPAGGTFQTFRVWAFNKAQMYAGAPTVQVVSFSPGSGDFTVLPSNARLQTGTPPPGTPNYFVSSWNFLNALTVYKFHVDWNRISLSTFTGPDVPLAATSWPNAAVANAPQSGTATLLDVLQIRAMMQNQYTNFGGVESLWNTHTVRRANTTGFAAPRWYQANVTGGTVAANLPQAATWDPDGANVMHRFIPSLALDRAGNLAIGYSTSSSTTFPSIKYAGRLAGDPINTFSKTEQVLFTGTASQTGSTRWGDYSAMTLDPDGCTFWFTSEYANPVSQAANQRWLTRIGAFKYAECTPVGAGGTLSGTVTVNPGGAPISGATITFGSRTTTTDINGDYSFTGVPAGTYPSVTASAPGYNSSTATNIVIADAATTDQDFALTAAPTTACLIDTTQADFQTGVGTNVDLDASPGDVKLLNAPNIDQQNTAGTTTGTGFGTPNWTGQTFIAAVTGQLVKADIQVFCNGCGATPPNLTLSVRATSGGLPTGADLATATIPGSLFASGGTVSATGTFGAPPTLTSGTQYALILRPVAVPAGTGYFWIRSSPSTYANGQRVLSADSGATWTADSTRDYNFKTFMQTGFAASGNLVSGVKDSNPAVGYGTTWTTLSWNATVPANTALSFQVAASNSSTGPFNFVGPDGTAGTFFTTSGASLSQFN
ncbi:MAG TPA: carboxypeptidase-like regulatory domain-containing protein, partial [Micromonosporaceae bacterium]|nr:carboxypeptidase-like regulatory domain-containing protein [Micromonosporaceae bacterium]